MMIARHVAFALALMLSIAAVSAAPVTLTDIESDTSAAGFPPGSDGEWTRFGAAYNGLSIDTVPANAAAGNNSVTTSADWAAGSFYGIRYNIPGAGLDVSAGPVISYQAMHDGVGNPTISFVIVETDGDIWSGGAHALTTSYAQHFLELSAGNLTLADASGGGDLDLILDLVGFDILANGETSGAPVFHMDEILWGETAPVDPPPVLPLVTSIEPPDTTSGLFPPDTTSLTFPDGSAEGDWTRFGAAYSGIAIVSDAAGSSHQDHHLQVSADWTAGNRVGIRYLPFGQPSDWSGSDVINWDVRADAVNAATTHSFALFEGDGDIWVGPDRPIENSYGTISLDLNTDLTLDGTSAGDGSINLADIILFGLNFDNAGGSGAQTFSVDHFRLTDSAPPGAPVLPLITTLDPPDFTTAGFPDGAEFEWTRFGAAYAGGMSIVNDPGTSSDGDRHLEVTASWGAGDLLGLRYLQFGLPGTPVDWSPYERILFDVRADVNDVNTTVEFALFEGDGDIWVSDAVAVTDSYQTVGFNLSTDFTADPFGTGDGTMDLTSVAIIGPNFRNTSGSGTQTLSVDFLRLSEPATAVQSWTIYH